MIPRFIRRLNGFHWENEVAAGIRDSSHNLQVRNIGSTFNLPDVIVQSNIGIECKNWGIEFGYTVDADDILTQVLPKYQHTKYAYKVLAYKRKMLLSAHAWQLLRKNKIIVTFGLEHLLQVINRLLTSSCDADIHYNDLFSCALFRLCNMSYRKLQLLFSSPRQRFF